MSSAPLMTDGEYVKEFKKLDLYLKDLRAMQSELLPDDGKNGSKDDTKGLDKWSKQKLLINNKLKDIREGVDKLDEYKKTLGPGERDAEVIKLMNTNARLLKEVTADWGEMKQILINDEKKTGKKKMDKKTISDRRKMTKNLGKEILDLGNRNSHVPQSGGATDADLARLDQREKRTNQKREERRAKRKNRKKGKGDEDEMDDLQAEKDAAPMSQQEQAFMEQRDQAYAEQDEILDIISKGLDELLEIGEDINKTLVLQEHMLDEVEKKVDRNIVLLQGANQRLKHMLEETGGLERWCPLIILGVVLLALLGYIYTITSG